MKPTIVQFACILAVGCCGTNDQCEPETGSSRIVFELRDEAQKELEDANREIDSASGQLTELQIKLARTNAVVESAAADSREMLQDRDQLLSDVERLARSRDVLSDQSRACEEELQEMSRQTAQLRREIEEIEAHTSTSCGSASRNDECEEQTLPLTGRVEISTYGDASVRIPVGDGYVAAGEHINMVPRAMTHEVAHEDTARPEQTRAAEIRKARQDLKEYMRQQAIPEGYRLREVTYRSPALAVILRRARATGGYRPFYFPDGDDPQFHVEMYVDRAGGRVYYLPRAIR